MHTAIELSLVFSFLKEMTILKTLLPLALKVANLLYKRFEIDTVLSHNMAIE